MIRPMLVLVVIWLTVTGTDDAIDDGNSTSTITHTASSTDSNYSGISIASTTVTTVDNDTAGVSFSATSSSPTEGGATPTYTVVLDSEPTGNVQIDISGDTQATTTPTSLTFTSGNWNATQTVTVTAVDDAIAEGAHTGTITHTASSTDSNYDGISISNHTANITDNDTAGVTLSSTSTSATEGGATGSYTIVLDSEPTGNVQIDTSVNNSEVTATPSLTFTSANWNATQTITVTATDDSTDDGDLTSIITHTASSTDSNYEGISVASTTATAIDNDSGGLSFASNIPASVRVDIYGPENTDITTKTGNQTIQGTTQGGVFTAHFTNLTEGTHTFTITAKYNSNTQTKTFTMSTAQSTTYKAQDITFSFDEEAGGTTGGTTGDNEELILQLLAQIKLLQAQIAAILGELPKTDTQTNIPPPSLSFGDQGPNVTNLQTILATMSDIYPQGLITGYFGPLTQGAIQTLQLKYNVLQTPDQQGYGVYGPKTSQRLGEVIAN